MVAERQPEQRAELAAVPRVCRNGHAQTVETLYRDTSGRERCLPCIRETRRRYALKNPRARVLAPRRRSCPNGHAYTDATTYHGPDGARRCIPCRRINAREKRDRDRAKRLAPQTANQPAQTPKAVQVVRQTPTPCSAPVRGLQAAPSVFATIAAGQATRIAAAKAQGPTPWADTLRTGEQAVRERVIQMRGSAAGRVTPEAIIAATADAFSLTVADLTGKCRDKDCTWPRHLAAWAIRKWCPGVGVTAIGQHLGGRDHTTVMYAVDKIACLVEAGDGDTMRDLDYLREALEEMGR